MDQVVEQEQPRLRIVRPPRERRLCTPGNPEELFTEIPKKEHFEEVGREFLIACDEWEKATEVGIAVCTNKLIALRDAPIGYLWKKSGGKRAGRAVLGKAMRASALVRTFSDRKGFVVLSADHIANYRLTRYQFEALIYHELLHFRYEDGDLVTHGHDFEAFVPEVEEYGLWKPDLRAAGEAFGQIPLL